MTEEHVHFILFSLLGRYLVRGSYTRFVAGNLTAVLQVSITTTGQIHIDRDVASAARHAKQSFQ